MLYKLIRILLFFVNWPVFISIAILYVDFVTIIFINLCMSVRAQNIIQFLNINNKKNILGDAKIWIFLSH